MSQVPQGWLICKGVDAGAPGLLVVSVSAVYQVYQDLLIDNYYLLLLHNLNFAEKSEFLGALLNAQQHKDALPSHNAQQDQGLSPQH